MINNAGIGGFKDMEAVTFEDFEKIYRVNVYGVALMGARAARLEPGAANEGGHHVEGARPAAIGRRDVGAGREKKARRTGVPARPAERYRADLTEPGMRQAQR